VTVRELQTIINSLTPENLDCNVLIWPDAEEPYLQTPYRAYTDSNGDFILEV
jgi:hypothetical protein